MPIKGRVTSAALVVAFTCQPLCSAPAAAAGEPATPSVPATNRAFVIARATGFGPTGVASSPPAREPAEVAGVGFEAQRFGVPLSPREQEQLEGYFWWSVAFGMMDAVWRYAAAYEFRPRSWRYWGRMAAAAAIGGTVGAFSGGYASAVQAAGRLGRWAGASLRLYGYARTKALNEAIYRGQAYYWRDR